MSQMGEPKPKSFDISKRAVWEAYRRVKANKGSAGVDGQSMNEFEENLQGNLYRLWNRLASGSYFPPPVRVVNTSPEASYASPASRRSLACIACCR